jgi:hypothetical protein
VKRCEGREEKFEPSNVTALLVTMVTRAPFQIRCHCSICVSKFFLFIPLLLDRMFRHKENASVSFMHSSHYRPTYYQTNKRNMTQRAMFMSRSGAIIMYLQGAFLINQDLFHLTSTCHSSCIQSALMFQSTF